MPISKDFFSKEYFFNRQKSNYANYFRWDNDAYWQPVLKKIKKLNIKGNALDIGCAFGFFLKRIENQFQKTYGADISKFALKEAKKQTTHTKYNLLDLNKDNLPYPNNYFDLITAFDVLEHTNSVENSLKKIIPKLKKDAYLFISLPLKDTWAGKIFSWFDKDKSHVSVPSKKELFQIINNLPLQIIDQHYFWNLIFVKIKGIPTEIDLLLRKK